MHTTIATAIVLSLAFAPQPRGWVSSVTAAADASVGTYRFTVRGNNPCGAVNVDFGDGTTAVTHAITQVPVTIPHEYMRVGEFTIRARGMGNCDGDVFTRVNVQRVRPLRQNRFSEMDQNGDGIITRAEWRGTAVQFEQNDWNDDGRLSGDEVLVGATPPSMRFAQWDQNRDGVITRAEWRGTVEAFERADWNNDNRLSGDELREGAERPNVPDEPIRFKEMDLNKDKVITRTEWRGNAIAFTQHDWNADGVLSGDELKVGAKPRYEWTEASFRRFDRNRDNYLSGNEWRYEPDDFVQVDRNGDDRISLAEFVDGDTALGGGFEAFPGRGRGRGRGNNDPVQTVIVTNNQAWIDTGINVRANDVLDISATGQVRFSRRAFDFTGPNGAPGNRANAPMPNRAIGALVARVGNSAPFFVGANANNLRAPLAGRLYLGVNDDILTDNSGEYRVVVSVNRR